MITPARPASCASLGKIEDMWLRIASELAEAEHAAWKPLADGEHGFGTRNRESLLWQPLKRVFEERSWDTPRAKLTTHRLHCS